ncbi:pro-melanin-concentrating hormone, like [Pholidichthys leucotaenia]
MRLSLTSVIFAVALFFRCYPQSVALPMGKTEDSSMEQDPIIFPLSDEATEQGLNDAAVTAVTKSRWPRVIIIGADPNLWQDLRVLHNGLPIHKRTADENGPVTEHRDVDQDLSIPMLRRDTMRCMVGRVYRPCWEV